MNQFIGCHAHKRFGVFAVMKENGEYEPVEQVSSDRLAMRAYLQDLPPGSEIAVEAGGTYYWLVDEMKAAGHHARLAHPSQAKQRMRGRNKTDAEDARGLAMLLRNRTLPLVWIPSAELRDQRAMLRLRMKLVELRSGLKNRIQGSLAQYNIQCGSRDVFGDAGLHRPRTKRAAPEDRRT
jgi:transposase